MTLIRLNKYLASIGIASRRKIDVLINASQINVNGKPATLGQKINPKNDKISLSGQPIDQSVVSLVYIILNKPVGILSSAKDDRGRRTVVDLVQDKTQTRLFPVGRLDLNSSGLILLTNDGELALKLTHPRYHLPKVYLVTVKGKVDLDLFQTATVSTQIFHENRDTKILKMTLTEGKKRQIRLMCSMHGLEVVSLHRIQIGPLSLGKLKTGESRFLTPNEIKNLIQA